MSGEGGAAEAAPPRRFDPQPFPGFAIAGTRVLAIGEPAFSLRRKSATEAKATPLASATILPQNPEIVRRSKKKSAIPNSATAITSRSPRGAAEARDPEVPEREQGRARRPGFELEAHPAERGEHHEASQAAQDRPATGGTGSCAVGAAAPVPGGEDSGHLIRGMLGRDQGRRQFSATAL